MGRRVVNTTDRIILYVQNDLKLPSTSYHKNILSAYCFQYTQYLQTANSDMFMCVAWLCKKRDEIMFVPLFHS